MALRGIGLFLSHEAKMTEAENVVVVVVVTSVYIYIPSLRLSIFFPSKRVISLPTWAGV